MNRRIVLGIDANISPQTRHVLRIASSLLELSAPQLGVVLLHVIPLPDITPSKFGMSRVTPTAGQRELAEHALQRARIELQKQGIVPERIEILLRSGTPADEIVKAAKERDADFIMIGSRGNSLLTYRILVDGKVYWPKNGSRSLRGERATRTTTPHERLVAACKSRRRKSVCSVSDRPETVRASSCLHTSRTGCSSPRPRSVR